ncbi:PKD domain-containing protein, partial [Candidatus Woesearchaeota archaeon]|nr:PKD domain-containing protein [Candidatus Woesearchaeota archaeon]
AVFQIRSSVVHFTTIRAHDVAANITLSRSATVNFVKDDNTSTLQSTVDATSPHYANGIDASTVTVTLRNMQGQPLINHQVQITSSRPSLDTITALNAQTNAGGQAVFRVTSLTVGQSIINATDVSQNVHLIDTAAIDFIPNVTLEIPDTNLSTVDATSPHYADGIDASQVTVTLFTSAGTPIVGHQVSVVTTSTDDALTVLNSITDASGQAQFEIRSTVPHNTTVYARDETSGTDLTDTAQVEFRPVPQNNNPSVIITNPLDLASFTTGQPILFTALGTDPDGDALTYYWFFGDGASSFGQNSQHTYLMPGTYPVSVVASDGRGGFGTDSISVIVTNQTQPPQNTTPLYVNIVAIPEKGKAPLHVEFSAIVAGGNGHYAYSWDFGDGSSSTDAAPTHIYQEQGAYNVRLWVVDTDGNAGFDKTVITVTDHEDSIEPQDKITISGLRLLDDDVKAGQEMTLIVTVENNDASVKLKDTKITAVLPVLGERKSVQIGTLRPGQQVTKYMTLPIACTAQGMHEVEVVVAGDKTSGEQVFRRKFREFRVKGTVCS